MTLIVRRPGRECLMPAPLRRNRPQAEEQQECDCCEADCQCEDCERCRDAALQVAKDWVPPPATGQPAKKAGR